MTLDELKNRVGSVAPWFHSIDLPYGVVTPGQGSQAFIKNAADIYFAMGIEGRTVLDVGAWDGAFSFEAERRGAADILAVDELAWHPASWTGGKAGFDLCHEALESRVRSRRLDLPQVTLENVGPFDIVLYNGIVYHVLDPIRDLIEMSRIARYALTVETYIDNLEYPRPVMNFFPGEKMPVGLPQTAGVPTHFSCTRCWQSSALRQCWSGQRRAMRPTAAFSLASNQATHLWTSCSAIATAPRLDLPVYHRRWLASNNPLHRGMECQNLMSSVGGRSADILAGGCARTSPNGGRICVRHKMNFPGIAESLDYQPADLFGAILPDLSAWERACDRAYWN